MANVNENGCESQQGKKNESSACIVHFYLANEHFESRMLVDRVAQKLVDLFSTSSAAYFLLQGVVCWQKQRASQPLSVFVITS